MHPQELLRDVTGFTVAPNDGRRIDALATGLPFYHGRPLFCDATLRSPLNRPGGPQPRARAVDGATFREAERDKEGKYPEVVNSEHAELLTLAADGTTHP